MSSSDRPTSMYAVISDQIREKLAREGVKPKPGSWCYDPRSKCVVIDGIHYAWKEFLQARNVASLFSDAESPDLTPVEPDPEKAPAPYGAIEFDPYGRPRIGDWIQTFQKVKFHPEDIRDEDMDILDIAHALSLVNRFNGHTKAAYSVAEHCVRCARLVREWHPHDTLLILEALLHDASEAYIADIARPIKHLPQMAPYRELERGIERAIALKFGTATIMSPAVKRADEILLTTEARDLMAPLIPGWSFREHALREVIVPWSADLAEHEFLSLFRELTEAPPGSPRAA